MDPFVAQVNLAFQILIFCVFAASLVLAKRKKLLLHGKTVFVALVLNTASFFIVMLPSLLSLIELVVVKPLYVVSVGVLAHASLGVVTEILAIWLVASWGLQSSLKRCVRRKKIMWVATAFWFATLLLGMLLYLLLYVI
jgi:uncharacterized membrane protein YozB (DUF420 family)